MMIFYQMRGRETTFQSPMVRVVLSRITLLKSVFFCRSFLYRKKKRRRKECVTHEIRITGIAWCKRKEGILSFPLFTFSLLLAAVREPDRELRHCRCHRKEELLHRLHQDRELHLHQALSFRCLRKALREP